MDPEAVNSDEQRAEKLQPREELIGALKRGLEIFEEIPEEERNIKQKAETAEIKRKLQNVENGGSAVEVIELKGPRDGSLGTEREGIAINNLLVYLEQKRNTLGNRSPGAKELDKIIALLTQRKYTKDYLDIANRWKPAKFQARVKLETERMKEDGRAIGNPDRDTMEATKDLLERRELLLPPIPPTPPEEEGDFRWTISFVDASDDARKIAREEAGESVREAMRIRNRWNPGEWFRSIGFRLGETYHKLDRLRRAQEQQIETGNYIVEIDAISGAIREVNTSRDLMNRQLSATAVRFSTIRSERDLYESEEVASLENREINSQINDLITRFARAEVNEDQFMEEQTGIIDSLKQNPQTAHLINQDTRFIADNFLEVAQKVRLSYERGQFGLENLERALNIQIGRAVMAATTEADYNLAERYMNWAQEHRLFAWTANNPLFVGAAFGLADAAAKMALGAGARFTGLLILGGLLGAGIAGLRRYIDLKRDWELNERDLAYSRAGEDRRRSNLDRFSYNAPEREQRVTAAGLIDNIERLSRYDNLASLDGQNALIRTIAEADERINYGIRHKIDLMDFSDRHSTELQKLQILEAKLKALEKLREVLSRSGDYRNGEQINQDIERRLELSSGEFRTMFEGRQSDVDRRFNTYRAIDAFRHAAIGGVTALTGGLVTEELFALAARKFMNVAVGATTLENLSGFIPAGGGLTKEIIQNLFQNLGNLSLGNDLELRLDPYTLAERFTERAPGGFDEHVRAVTFWKDGKQIDTAPLFLTDDGRVIKYGPDQLPDIIRDILGRGKNLPGGLDNQWFNLKEDLTDMIVNNRHDAFISWHHMMVDVKGSVGSDILSRVGMDASFLQGQPVKLIELTYAPENPIGSTNRLVFTALGTVENGQPHILFSQTIPGNESLTRAQIELISRELQSDSWAVNSKLIQGKQLLDFMPINATEYTPTTLATIPPFLIPTPFAPREPLGPRRQPGQPGPLPEDGDGLPVEDQGIQESGPRALVGRFGSINGEYPARDHPLYIENPPDREALDQERLERLAEEIPDEPFFVLRNGHVAANPSVVPWTDFENNRRFINAERSTNGDSGLLAMAATLTDTLENQAKLYWLAAGEIVKIHSRFRNRVSQWLLNTQNRPIEGTDERSNPARMGDEGTSLNLFVGYDYADLRNLTLRPENEVLFPYDQDRRVIADPETVADFWSNRVRELERALEEDQLQAHHLRWIEFLSHSVNINELFRIIKDAR